MQSRPFVVRSLFRNTLRQCVRLGYRCGDWNEQMSSVTYVTMTKRRIRRMDERGELGHYIFGHVRYYYGNTIHVRDRSLQNELIDHGFVILRVINKAVGGNTSQLRHTFPPVTYLLEDT